MRRLVTVSSAWQAARMDKRMPGAFRMRVTSRRRLRAAGWWCFRDRAAVFFPVLAVTHLSRTDEGVVFSCDGILPCDSAILSRSAGGLFYTPVAGISHACGGGFSAPPRFRIDGDFSRLGVNVRRPLTVLFSRCNGSLCLHLGSQLNIPQFCFFSSRRRSNALPV